MKPGTLYRDFEDRLCVVLAVHPDGDDVVRHVPLFADLTVVPPAPVAPGLHRLGDYWAALEWASWGRPDVMLLDGELDPVLLAELRELSS